MILLRSFSFWEIILYTFSYRLFAETDTGCILGGSALGKRGVPAHEVGMQAAQELATSLKGQYCVDDYMQDQIIILMALADGKSVVKCGPISLHTKTAIHIAEMLTNVSKANRDCVLTR